MAIKGKIRPSTERHQRLHEELVALMEREGGDLPAIELLAVLSQTLGSMIAYQDQRIGADVIMELVSRNIEIGNQAAIDQTFGPTMGNA